MYSFTIHSWMISDLNLSGNELLLFANIYHFSSLKGNYFTASLKTMSEVLNVSLNTVQRVLKKLIDLGLIIKEDVIVNNTRYCRYSVIPSMQETNSQNGYGGIAKMDITHSQNGSQETNNIINTKTNISNNTKTNNIDTNNQVIRRGKLFDAKKGGEKKAQKYGRMIKILDAFLIEHKLISLKQLFLEYLTIRFKRGLEPEQWAKILEPLKKYNIKDIEAKLNTAIGAGYPVLVPAWELNKESKRVDNIREVYEDVDYRDSGMVF